MLATTKTHRKNQRRAQQRRDRYQYASLPPGQYVRIFILDSGAADQPLSGRLQIAEVSELAGVEAISYVWGDQRSKVPVMIDGKRLAITRNLDHALRSLRWKSKERKLWADAICINQKDKTEQGHQVKFMGSVYKSASRVLICVGPDPDGIAREVQNLVRDVDSMITRVLENYRSTGGNGFPNPEQNDPLLNDKRWKSYQTLCNLEWFNRGWVVQEAGLARTAQIVWGETEIDWVLFLQADTWIWARVPSRETNLSGLHCLQFHRESAAIADLFALAPVTDPLEILHHARGLDVGDERDHIYAFLGLVDEYTRDDLNFVEPDYTRSTHDVYVDFAKGYLESSGDLRLLHFTHHSAESLRLSPNPSWVPRWDSRPGVRQFTFGIDQMYTLTSRDGTWPAPQLHPYIQLVTVRGVFLGGFKYLSNTNRSSTQGTISERLSRIWHDVKELSASESPYEQDMLSTAFWDCCTMLSYTSDYHDSRAAEQAYMKHITSSRPDAAVEGVQEADLRDKRLMLMTEGHLEIFLYARQFAVTERGYFALVPDFVRHGDVHCVAFGSYGPLVLRKVDGSDTFQLLGDAFIPGKQVYIDPCDQDVMCYEVFGTEASKDWIDWDVEEQDITIC